MEKDDCPKKELQQWVVRIGMHRLRHLRDRTIRIEHYEESETTSYQEFSVKLDNVKGLDLYYSFSECDESDSAYKIQWGLAILEFKRKKLNWKGESIVFLLLDGDELEL